MAELNSRPTDESVQEFLQSVDNEKKRRDSLVILDLMKEVTGDRPKMWSSSIVGFGSYHYKYKGGVWEIGY